MISGFNDNFICSLCFAFISNCREVCKNEFIIPLGPELKELYHDEEMRHSLRSLQAESVRPQLRMTEIVYVFNVKVVFFYRRFNGNGMHLAYQNELNLSDF